MNNTRVTGKFVAKQNKNGLWDVRVVNPRGKKGFRKFDPNSRTDVPFRNLPYEDNARLAAAHYSQYGNPHTERWEDKPERSKVIKEVMG